MFDVCEVISHEGPTSSPVSLEREPGNEVDEGLLSQVFLGMVPISFAVYITTRVAWMCSCKVQMHVKPLVLST